VVCFLANYLLSGGFGLYEDDYFYTLPPMAWTPSEFFHELRVALVQWIQGRPIGNAANAVLAYVTGRFSSLQVAYLAGWLILTINGVLIHRLLVPLLGTFPSAIAALLYVVYPVDAAKIILMHRAIVHFAMTQLLLSLWLFQRNRWPGAYALAVSTILTYESFFLPFIIAPFLCVEPHRRTAAAVIRHAAIFTGLAVAVLGVRYVLGEERATLLVSSAHHQVIRIALAPLIGAGTALRAILARPLDVVLSGSAWALALAALATGLLWMTLPSDAATPRTGDEPTPLGPWRLALVGLGALACSYVLAFRAHYYPPIMSVGRLSGVHAAGALGGSLLIGSLTAVVSRSAWRRGVEMVWALWLGLLVAYGIHIQYAEYVTSWKLQADFWRAIVSQSSDAEDGTLVVVDGSTFSSRTRGIITVHSALGNEWVLPRWFVVPPTWHRPPLLVCDAEGITVRTQVTADGVLVQCPGWWGEWLWSAKSPVLRDGNFILVRYIYGQYRRVFDEVTIGGQRLKPKPLGAPTPGLELSTLYRRLFEQAPSARWDRLGGRCWHPDNC
jgi:hypothetical protein